MNKFVVYTAIVGGYDKINQPEVIDNRFDYVLFSNDIQENQVGVWQVRSIPYYNEDKTRIARWVKTHPEELLADYEVSVWMDGALVIRSKYVYERVLDLFGNDVAVSSMWHDQRDCAYDEAVEVAVLGLEHENIVVDWMHFLLSEKYPEYNGLFETNVMYRNHRKPDIQALDRLWWNCIDHYSRRDQLSFNYSIWKKGMVCPFFFAPPENARNSKYIQCVTNHVGTDKTWRVVNRDRRKDVLLYYYSTSHNGRINKNRIKRLYIIASSSFSPLFLVNLFGFYYRLVSAFSALRRKCSNRY